MLSQWSTATKDALERHKGIIVATKVADLGIDDWAKLERARSVLNGVPFADDRRRNLIFHRKRDLSSIRLWVTRGCWSDTIHNKIYTSLLQLWNCKIEYEGKLQWGEGPLI
jgi:hypothetical protein